MFVSRSSFEKPRPFDRCVAHDVAVERVDEQAAALELGRHELGDRRLAGARKAGEPEDEARTIVPSPGAGPRPWMPHSILSEFDHRPARSSSPRRTGRVHGMHPIDGYPMSWSGLYGDLVDDDVGLHALCVPVDERVDLPDAVALGPLHLRRVGARQRLLAADRR